MKSDIWKMVAINTVENFRKIKISRTANYTKYNHNHINIKYSIMTFKVKSFAKRKPKEYHQTHQNSYKQESKKDKIRKIKDGMLA